MSGDSGQGDLQKTDQEREIMQTLMEAAVENDTDPEIQSPDSADLENTATVSASPETEDAYAGWVALVDRIRSGETDGMEELYQLFSRGIRYYLCRQLGPQELDDKIHDSFLVVVRKGDSAGCEPSGAAAADGFRPHYRTPTTGRAYRQDGA